MTWNFCKYFKNKESEEFKINSYGELSWLLNNKTERIEREIILSQEGCIEKLIEKFNLSDWRKLETTLNKWSKPWNVDSP